MARPQTPQPQLADLAWRLALPRTDRRRPGSGAGSRRLPCDRAPVHPCRSGLPGRSPTAEQVAALEARTEGWAAGLQLAGIAMRDRADPAAFIASFAGSNRAITDYLVEKVLHRQPAASQQFLLATAALDRMCAELCDALIKDATPIQTLHSPCRATACWRSCDDPGDNLIW